MGVGAPDPASSRRGDLRDEYAVRCPKCRREAVASMFPVGIKGTYQEPFVKLGAARITCTSCGFARDTRPGEESRYELLYTTRFDAHKLWATNRRHLDFLISWLGGEVEDRPDDVATRAYLSALPKWLRRRRNRPALLLRLRRLRGDIDA